MKFFSTFTGIGGFEIGIQNAYRSAIRGSKTNSPGNEGQGLLATQGQNTSTSERSTRPGGDNLPDQRPLCVGYSEIDKFARTVYERHNPGVKNYGDITKINADELPDFDCLVGGFPCQAFSIAGKRAGFNDTRGTLFFDLARILKAKQPRIFVFENVKGLLSHDNGNTFKTIIAAIDELGYDCQWQVLNSKNHGVPQNRERIIIVGHLRGTPRPEVFPLADTDFTATAQQFTSTTIDANYWKGIDNHGQRTAIIRLNNPVHSTHRIYSPEGISPALSTMQGGGRQPYISLSRDGADSDSQAHTDGVRETAGVPRRLDVMSDTQRYKMCGNAVTTNVIRDVFIQIFKG